LSVARAWRPSVIARLAQTLGLTLIRLIAIATLASFALECGAAGASTCELAETAGGLVITNLTSNMGCSDEPMKSLCKAFLTCIRSQATCLVVGGKVYGGTSARDFSRLKLPLTFGTRRVSARNDDQVCFLAVLGQAPGEEEPSWSSMVVEPNGWQGTGRDYQPRQWLTTPAEFFVRSEQATSKRQPSSTNKQ
jgi:hypothetical protein